MTIYNAVKFYHNSGILKNEGFYSQQKRQSSESNEII